MPVGGTNNFNLIKGITENIKVMGPDTLCQDSNEKLTEKINMEAYQAYYNTNENANGLNPSSGS